MVNITFKWGEFQPTWVTNAGEYAGNKLGLSGKDKQEWIRSTLGFTVSTTDQEISLIFENDTDYTATVLRWS